MSFCDWPAWLRLCADFAVVVLVFYAWRVTKRAENCRIANESLLALVEKMREEPQESLPHGQALSEADVTRLAGELMAHMRSAVRKGWGA